MTTPPIKVHQLTRRFGATVALRDVDLIVPRSEVHALLGPNGAGKTTLLRVIAGSVQPTSGSVEVMGRPWEELAGRSAHAAFGLVTSGERSSYHRLSGAENLMFFARLHGLSKRQARSRALELLDQVGLAEAADIRTGHYSHGMQKRLSMARALIMNPPVLLVDEATHDLDPLGAKTVRELLKKAAVDGVAVLWATQRVDEIQDTADRVTVLHRGEVRFSGRVEELARILATRRYRVELLSDGRPAADVPSGVDLHLEPLGDLGVFRLSLEPAQALGEAVIALQAAGRQVVDCRPETSNIEDGFLALTRDDPL